MAHGPVASNDAVDDVAQAATQTTRRSARRIGGRGTVAAYGRSPKSAGSRMTATSPLFARTLQAHCSPVQARPDRATKRRAVHPRTWYGRPTGGACVRPTFEPDAGGRTFHCPLYVIGRSVLPTPTRGRTGNQHLGRRSRIRKRTLSRGGSREGSRLPLTSRVTGSFGHQARKAVGLAALIEIGADHRSIALRDSRGAIFIFLGSDPVTGDVA